MASAPDTAPSRQDLAPATDAIGRTLRHDGWTPERQQSFLRAIADGATVQSACAHVGLSVASAYALRARAGGAAFALGWSAANHLARQPLADGLLARALDGQVEWYTRANGERAERFRYDNGLASRMLARLDRHAEAEGPAAQAAARMVASEFEAFVALLGRDGGPARAGLFLAARVGETDLAPLQALARADCFARAGAGLACEIDTADLDIAARAGWTVEQWQRAEAAGLLRLAPAPVETPVEPQQPQLVPFEDTPVWWDEDVGEWRTNFPPPPGFDGEEKHSFGEDFYERELTQEELAIVERDHERGIADEVAAAAVERDSWFAARARAGEADATGGPEPAEAPAEERALPSTPQPWLLLANDGAAEPLAEDAAPDPAGKPPALSAPSAERAAGLG